MIYRVVLFLHIAGVVATFVGVGVWLFATLTVRQAHRTEELRSLASMYEMGAALALTGILMIAASGLHMALTVWGLSAGWIQVATGAFVLMAPVGPLIIGPRIELLIRDARELDEGPLSAGLSGRIKDPVIKVGTLLIIGDLLGIVYVMTVKPSFGVSIVAIVASVSVAALFGIPTVGRALGSIVDSLAKLERSNPLYRH